ncbi:MAG TPA: hypothetical protein VEL73_03350 [Mycobacteriales bacterium]|nr:hypothetical protein [Mycobacteriales bacterium]
MIVSKRAALGIAGVSAAVVLGTAGVTGLAAASNGTGGGRAPVAALAAPSPSGSAGSTPSPRGPGQPHERGAGWGKRGGFGALGRGLHGEWVVKDKDGKYVTLVTVRGQVTASSPTSITIKAEDGYTATYAINSDTIVRAKAGGIKVGDQAGAVGEKSGGTVTARAVVDRAK